MTDLKKLDYEISAEIVKILKTNKTECMYLIFFETCEQTITTTLRTSQFSKVCTTSTITADQRVVPHFHLSMADFRIALTQPSTFVCSF